MTDKHWKAGERRIAKKFNTKRTPLSGGNSRHTMSDTLHKRLFIEVKHKKVIPGNNLGEQTKQLAKKEKKIPMIVFIKKNHPEPIVLCKLNDLKKITEEMKEV